LRSESTTLTDQGATILGIVGQDIQALTDYVARSPLPFPLLSDDDRAVMQAYDVFNALSFDAFRIAHPSAFIIDPAGTIRYTYVASNQMDWPPTHLVAEELARLRGADASGGAESV
jgi:peroxiredoxin